MLAYKVNVPISNHVWNEQSIENRQYEWLKSIQIWAMINSYLMVTN